MFTKIIDSIVLFIGKIHWPTKRQLSVADQDKIRLMLVDNYFIVLTRRNNHLSTYFTGIASFLVNRKWGFWSHAVMNLEDELTEDADFRIVSMNAPIELMARERALIEATGAGTQVAPFEKVFDVHAAVLMKPKSMSLDDWTGVLDSAKAQLGKPYDTLFNIADDKKLSCVELVRVILQSRQNYERDFANFEASIRKYKNLSPQMFYDCPDFEVVFEARV